MLIDYTMIEVAQVLGISGLLVTLHTQSCEEWQRTAGAFAAAGLPMVVRGA